MITGIATTPARQSAPIPAVSPGGSRLDAAANAALHSAARLWFLVAVLGQWMFAYYVAAFYGGSAVRGDMETWNEVFPRGHVAGDAVGNLVVAVHLLLAVVLLVGGPLQLVPQVRTRVPAFHRWNGRIYVAAAAVTSMGGLYLVWIRGGTAGDLSQHVSISINAALILLCAAMALRYAVAGDLGTHRRWALRLFLVVSGVWFFRVGLMLWLVANRGPAGFDPETFQGPVLTFLAFAQYLVPLAVLELYLRAKTRGGTPARLAVAAGLLVLTIAMGVGIFAATMGMWLPRL